MHVISECFRLEPSHGYGLWSVHICGIHIKVYDLRALLAPLAIIINLCTLKFWSVSCNEVFWNPNARWTLVPLTAECGSICCCHSRRNMPWVPETFHIGVRVLLSSLYIDPLVASALLRRRGRPRNISAARDRRTLKKTSLMAVNPNQLAYNCNHSFLFSHAQLTSHSLALPANEVAPCQEN